MPTLAAPALADFVARLFLAVGVNAEESGIVAESLVGANLRGHDSHGVMRALQYLDFVRNGDYTPGAELIIEQDSPGAVVADGQWGFGQVQAHRLLGMLIPRARELGIAAGAGRRFGHCGRLGEYAERAAAEGLILIATVNNDGAGQRVAPPGGTTGRLGTNPLCAGVPTGADPVVLDFGTSVVAEGKVRTHYLSNRPVPVGWLVDSQGEPTNDPSVLYVPPLGGIRPMGGEQSYKGFGLALVLDLLSGGLSGGHCSHPGAGAAKGNCLFFAVIDPGRFAGLGSVAGQASRLGDYIRETPRAAGVAAILLPGDPERIVLAERSAHGIPIDPAHWDRLAKAAADLGVEPPAVT
ncbi:MAG: Ldh family oxidoreductase [Isosphaeraceae bacterium]